MAICKFYRMIEWANGSGDLWYEPIEVCALWFWEL